MPMLDRKFAIEQDEDGVAIYIIRGDGSKDLILDASLIHTDGMIRLTDASMVAHIKKDHNTSYTFE